MPRGLEITSPGSGTPLTPPERRRRTPPTSIPCPGRPKRPGQREEPGGSPARGWDSPCTPPCTPRLGGLGRSRLRRFRTGDTPPPPPLPPILLAPWRGRIRIRERVGVPAPPRRSGPVPAGSEPSPAPRRGAVGAEVPSPVPAAPWAHVQDAASPARPRPLARPRSGSGAPVLPRSPRPHIPGWCRRRRGPSRCVSSCLRLASFPLAGVPVRVAPASAALAAPGLGCGAPRCRPPWPRGRGAQGSLLPQALAAVAAAAPGLAQPGLRRRHRTGEGFGVRSGTPRLLQPGPWR